MNIDPSQPLPASFYLWTGSGVFLVWLIAVAAKIYEGIEKRRSQKVYEESYRRTLVNFGIDPDSEEFKKYEREKGRKK